MKTPDTTKTVEDTVENLQICKKYLWCLSDIQREQAFRVPPECTLLRTGKIISFITRKNDQLLLSGMRGIHEK